MDIKPVKVLLIDDDASIRRCFRRYLEDDGYLVFEAGDGRTGLEVFEKEAPGAILVDLRMPDIDGMDVLKNVKEKSPDTPVIIISGAGIISEAIESVRLGAWDYLLKPLKNLSVIPYTIEKALEKARLIKENREYQEHLEFLVDKRTAELKQSNRKLEELNIRLSESEYKFRSLYEYANDAILIIKNEIIIDCNDKTLEIFKNTKESITGKNLLAFSPPEQPGGEESVLKIKQMIEQTLAGHPCYFEWKYKTPGEKTFFTEVSLSSIKLKAEEYIFAIIRDITARKLAESEIKKMNEKLESRVKERTRELQESMRELTRTQKKLVESEKMSSLGGLVAGVAHEINTPLGLGVTDATFLEEIVTEFKTAYTEERLTKKDFEKYLSFSLQTSKSIYSNLKRAAELIRSFKQVAVDRSSEAHRRFRIREYIENILKSMHSELKKTSINIIINCPGDLEINSYPGAFSQIITNFIMNSLIHGFENTPHGECVIEIAPADDKVLFTYSDNGKGMDEKTVKKIFDPFFTTKRGYGGSGLGMHIVYNLVTQTLGGEIHCHSSPGEGASFTLTIPMEQE